MVESIGGPMPVPPPLHAQTENFLLINGLIVGDQLYCRVQAPSFLSALYGGTVVPDWCDEDYENPMQEVLDRMEADYQQWLVDSAYALYWVGLDLSVQRCDHGFALARCQRCRGVTGG